ncbi:MAG: YdcF family protein [Fibrobacteria bacterium]|nr:YdcF family protein [Fibrobacteria bacterium]
MALVWIGPTWEAMVRDDSTRSHPSWVLVLDGWVPKGERAARGLELVSQQRADSVLISGALVAPGVFASTFQVRAQAPDSGLRGRIAELRHEATSTIEECRAAVAFFRSRHVDTIFLVTSDYHTDRAAEIFRTVSGGNPVALAVPAYESRFRQGWNREKWKTWLLEGTKRLEWFAWERWSTPSAGTVDPPVWKAVFGPEVGYSSVFAAPPRPCPPAPVCPVCPAPSEAGTPGNPGSPAAAAPPTEAGDSKPAARPDSKATSSDSKGKAEAKSTREAGKASTDKGKTSEKKPSKKTP